MIVLSNAGYVLVKMNGPTLSVLRANEASVLSFELLFRHTFACNIASFDMRTTEIEGLCGSVRIQLAVGLEDGQVFYCEHVIGSDIPIQVPQFHTMANMSSPISLLRLCAGFVVGVATRDGAAVMQLLYYNQGTSALHAQVSVDMLTYTCTDDDMFSTTQSWRPVSSTPSCITVIPALDCADEETCEFVSAYFGAQVVNALINTRTIDACVDGSSGGPEQVLVLVGCTDGTVWWFLSPLYSVVMMQLPQPNSADMDVQGADAGVGAVLRIQASLLGRYGAQISHIMVSSLGAQSPMQNFPSMDATMNATGTSSAGSHTDINQASFSVTCDDTNGVQCRSLLIVEETGTVNVLSVQDHCKQCTALPLSADISTVTSLWGVYIMYICCDTGALCAACPTMVCSADHVNSSSVSHNLSTNANTHTGAGLETLLHTSHTQYMVSTALTPESCPYIDNYTVCTASADVVRIVMHTGTSYRVCTAQIPCNSSPTGSANAVQHNVPTFTVQEGLNALCTACGMHRHPHTLTPAPGHHSISTVQQTTQVQQLQTTVSAIKIHQQQCMDVLEGTMQAENDIMQLQCMLQELSAPLVPHYTPHYAHADTGSHSTGTTSIFGTSIILSNHSQSLQLQYSLRSEPSITGAGAGCSTYMDLHITANPVSAMRALQGRTLTVTLASTQPSSSIHCSTITYTVCVNFTPSHSTGTGAHSSETPMYAYKCTVPVTSLAQLGSYRLSIGVPVHIDNDIQPAATVAESDGNGAHMSTQTTSGCNNRCTPTGVSAHAAMGASVCLVDQILSSTHMLQYVLQSTEFVSAQLLHAVCAQVSAPTGDSNINACNSTQRKLCVTVPIACKVHCDQLLAEWHRCINMYAHNTQPVAHTGPPILHRIPHNTSAAPLTLTRPTMLHFTHTSTDSNIDGNSVYALEGHSAEVLAHISAELHRVALQHLSMNRGATAGAAAVSHQEGSLEHVFRDCDMHYLDEHRQQIMTEVARLARLHSEKPSDLLSGGSGGNGAGTSVGAEQQALWDNYANTRLY